MSGSSPLLLLIAAVLATALLLGTTSAGGDLSWIPTKKAAACRGSIAECMGEGGEFSTDAVPRRSMLDMMDYISYDALLQGDSVPCAIGGASYYNCVPGAEANPYDRSCEAITQCRS